MIDSRGKTTDYAYTADDQLTLVTDRDSQATLTCYDGDGNLAETVPPVGVAANSLTASSCPTSYPTGYGDRLASDATTYAYDALGDKTTITTPAPAGQTGSETTTNAYDAAGRLTRRAPHRQEARLSRIGRLDHQLLLRPQRREDRDQRYPSRGVRPPRRFWLEFRKNRNCQPPS